MTRPLPEFYIDDELDITPESEEGDQFVVTACKVCSLDAATALATYLGGLGMETRVRLVEGEGVEE